MSLQAYACDDLLILDWSHPDGIQPGISVQVDDETVSKPVLGAEWVGVPRYLLVGRHPGIGQRSNPVIRIVMASGQTVAEYTARCLPQLPADYLSDCPLATRIRIEKILLLQVPRSFPQLQPATFEQLATCLVESSVFSRRCPDGSLYIRLPWMTGTEPALLSLTVTTTDADTAADRTVICPALAEGGYLHALIRQPEILDYPAHCWLLEVQGVRRTAVRLPDLPEIPRDVSWSPWLHETLLAAHTGDRRALKAFLLMQPGIGTPLKPRLMGQINGIRSDTLQGLAWNPGQPDQVLALEIRLDGQPLAEVEANLPHSARITEAPVNCGFLYRLDSALLGDTPHRLDIHERFSGAKVPGSPLFWGPGQFDGECSIGPRGTLEGWVAERCHGVHPLRVRPQIDGVAQAETLTRPDYPGKRSRFSVPLPDAVFDTREHRITLEVKRAGADEWFGLPQGVGVKTTYQGHIEAVGLSRVSGWIINRTAPERPVSLDLRLNDRTLAWQRAEGLRTDVADKPGRHGFEFVLPTQDRSETTARISLHLTGCGVEVLGPPVLVTPYEVAIQALAQAAALLNRQADETPASEPELTLWVRTQILGKLQTELRRARNFPARIDLTLGSLLRMPVYSSPDAVVDVIVPVYSSPEQTLRCLDSVLAARTDTAFELVVIDDASPEADLHTALRTLAGQNRLTLLENPLNQGFVASVNRGMQLHPGRDVVLLNSDTQVADGWLDRLKAAARREASTGTVTPLSNNATLCTIPQPETLDTAAMDALCARVNAGITVDIPTAVGFCMYIKRRVLDEVGYFNQALWGKGYAEENDFCLKAATLGWRHLAAADVFVWHEGGVSFGASKADRIQSNLNKLNQIYPDYAALIERFEARDALAPCRNRIVREWLKQHADRYVLFVIHGLGGGTQVAADTLARALATEGYPVLELMSKSPSLWQLTVPGLPYSLQYGCGDRWAALLDDLRYLGVWHVHYHQTMQFPLQIWDIPEALAIAYDVSLHDYLPICPRINLMDESGYYCDEARHQPTACNRCLALNGFDDDETNHRILRNKFAEFGQDVARWRDHYARILAGARRVIAPSQTVATIFGEHFPNLNLVVIPHPATATPATAAAVSARVSQPYQVIVMGAIGRHKGYDILQGMLKQAVKQGLPLHFHLIGYSCDDAALLAYPNISISGPYAADQLPERIAATQAGVALFLSPWPETYCFTLSEAWRYGLYPVALDIGAVGERIRASGQGLLLPLQASAKTINQALMDLFSQALPVVEPGPTEALTAVAEAFYGWGESTRPATSSGTTP
ncbi:MAG: hypothetical protein RLZZ226_2179 [Pseudomonadota bacterium]